MWIILILVVVCGPQQSHSQVQLTSTLQSEEGDQVTLSCGLTGTYTFPAWRGPPLLMVYTNLGDTSGNINPAAPAESRLQYATNNQDLLLSSSSTNDSGVYKCSYTALGDHTITLTVTEKVIQGPGPGKRCWCVCKDEGWKCFICWLIIILVVDIIIGLIMGCSMIYQPGCLDCEASDCSGCCKCCDKDIIRCKCCCWYIKSAPFWYYILWWTVIGTPVAFVIFIILKLKQPAQKHEDGNPVAIHLQNTKN